MIPSKQLRARPVCRRLLLSEGVVVHLLADGVVVHLLAEGVVVHLLAEGVVVHLLSEGDVMKVSSFRRVALCTCNPDN